MIDQQASRMINFCDELEKAEAIKLISSLLRLFSCEQVCRLLAVVQEHANVDGGAQLVAGAKGGAA